MLLLHLLLSCRYMLNWVKIRVWEQVQWDAVIMIDVDVTVLGDLTHLFKLPTDFAAVPDNGKIWNRYICTLHTSTSMKCPESPLQARPAYTLTASAAAAFACAFPFLGGIVWKGKGGAGGGGVCQV